MEVEETLGLVAYSGEQPYLFVSYAHRDGEEVLPWIKFLNDMGYRVWYDEGIDPGNEWPHEIEQALTKSAQFVVFVSEHSVESVNCRNEINFALNNRKPFLALYLSEVELKHGLGLRMGDIQAVFLEKVSDAQLARKLETTLDERLRDPDAPKEVPKRVRRKKKVPVGKLLALLGVVLFLVLLDMLVLRPPGGGGGGGGTVVEASAAGQLLVERSVAAGVEVGGEVQVFDLLSPNGLTKYGARAADQIQSDLSQKGFTALRSRYGLYPRLREEGLESTQFRGAEWIGRVGKLVGSGYLVTGFFEEKDGGLEGYYVVIKASDGSEVARSVFKTGAVEPGAVAANPGALEEGAVVLVVPERGAVLTFLEGLLVRESWEGERLDGVAEGLVELLKKEGREAGDGRRSLGMERVLVLLGEHGYKARVVVERATDEEGILSEGEWAALGSQAERVWDDQSVEARVFARDEEVAKAVRKAAFWGIGEGEALGLIGVRESVRLRCLGVEVAKNPLQGTDEFWYRVKLTAELEREGGARKVPVVFDSSTMAPNREKAVEGLLNRSEGQLGEAFRGLQ